MDYNGFQHDYTKLKKMFNQHFNGFTVQLWGMTSNIQIKITSDKRLCGEHLYCIVPVREFWITIIHLYECEDVYVSTVGNIDIVKEGNCLKFIDQDSSVVYGRAFIDDLVDFAENVNAGLNDLFEKYDL